MELPRLGTRRWGNVFSCRDRDTEEALRLMTKTRVMPKTTRRGTERADEDLVRLYLDDISRYPVLTTDDEVRLSQTLETGTQAEQDAARQQCVTATRKKRCA
jgi:hypothetical protein